MAARCTASRPRGELHNVLRVEGGRNTCRYTDENDCPAGFDIWVPRSYAHALAVLEAAGSQDSSVTTSSSAFTATRTAAARARTTR